MTTIDCCLSLRPKPHANINHERVASFCTVNNEPEYSGHGVYHSYTLKTKRGKRRRKRGQDRKNKQQRWCHTYWQRGQDKTWWGLWGLWLTIVRKNSQDKWGKRRPRKYYQRDGESPELVDSALVSWRCRLESGDVFSRHSSSDRELFMWSQNRAHVHREMVVIVWCKIKASFPKSILEILKLPSADLYLNPCPKVRTSNHSLATITKQGSLTSFGFIFMN